MAVHIYRSTVAKRARAHVDLGIRRVTFFHPPPGSGVDEKLRYWEKEGSAAMAFLFIYIYTLLLAAAADAVGLGLMRLRHALYIRHQENHILTRRRNKS